MQRKSFSRHAEMKVFEIIKLYGVFSLRRNMLLLSTFASLYFLFFFKLDAKENFSPVTFNFSFDKWKSLESPPKGWSLKNNLFPSDWEPSGYPESTGELEKIALPSGQSSSSLKSALLLSNGRILSKNIVLATRGLEGKYLNISIMARGQNGCFTLHLREYACDGAMPNDRIYAFATIINNQQTQSEWKEYSVRVKTRGRSFRFDLEGKNATIADIKAVLTQDDKTLPQMSLAIPQSFAQHTTDGILQSQEWFGAVGSMTGFMNIDTQMVISRQSEYLLSADETKLFIALKIPIPNGGFYNTAGGVPWENESIELYINPTPDRENIPSIYKILVDTNGTVNSEHIQNAIGIVDEKWCCKGLEVAIGQDPATDSCPNGTTVVEIAIPLESLGLKPGMPFGLNLCRNLQKPSESSDITGYGYRNYKFMYRCVISALAPGLCWGYSENLKEGRLKLHAIVTNPGKEKLNLVAKLQLGSIIDTQSCELAPGISREFFLDTSEKQLKTGLIGINIDRNSVSLASSCVRFLKKAPTENKSITKDNLSSPVEFYPIQKKLNICLRNLATRKKSTGIQEYGPINIFISKGDFHKALTASIQTVGDTGHITVPFVPPSKGIYQVKAVLSDKTQANVATETIIGSFEYQSIDWLGNEFGKERIIIPPFFPLTNDAGRISCLGRSYSFDGTGLPTSLISQGKEMLASPMCFVLQDGNGIHQGKMIKKSIIFDELAQDCIRFRGETKFPALDINIKGQIEYDGMIRYELELKPMGTVDIKKFALQIPMKNMLYFHWMSGIRSKAAWAMLYPEKGEYCDPNVQLWSLENFHNNSTEIQHDRQPLSLYLPRTEGLIWSSLGWRTPAIFGNFIPAITFGNHDYGLGWFADSDRGWINDEKHACFELIHEGNTFTLNINFISMPTKINVSRKIVFGLLATPVRPRIIGGDLALKLNCCGGSEYQFIKEHQGLVYDEPYLAKRMRDANKIRGYASAIYIGDSFPANDPATKACGYEWGNPSKLDTWGVDNLMPFLFYGTDPKNYISMSNCRYSSIIDYQMYCLKKDMELGLVDGVYFDNSFPKACANIQHENCGYIREDGKLQGGFHLFETREFCKRVATLSYSQGCMTPRLTVHMTSTLMPILCSFSDIYFDGEWSPSSLASDFIDYIGQPYIEGFASGAWGGNPGWLPFLGGGITRQKLALFKLYDLWIFMGRSKNPFATAEEKFGILEKDCRFVGYWQKEEGSLDCLPRGIKASYYLRPGRGVILYISNLNKENKNILLPANWNGWKGGPTRATDLESKMEIHAINGKYPLSIMGHDFRAILLEDITIP